MTATFKIYIKSVFVLPPPTHKPQGVDEYNSLLHLLKHHNLNSRMRSGSLYHNIVITFYKNSNIHFFLSLKKSKLSLQKYRTITCPSAKYWQDSTCLKSERCRFDLNCSKQNYYCELPETNQYFSDGTD